MREPEWITAARLGAVDGLPVEPIRFSFRALTRELTHPVRRGRSGEPSRTNAASRMRSPPRHRDAEKAKALTGFPNHCVRVSAGDLHSAHWNTPFAANQATAQIMASGLRELAGGADRIEHSGLLPGS